MKPTGHAICDTCSAIHSERMALEGIDGRAAADRRAKLNEKAEAHVLFTKKSENTMMMSWRWRPTTRTRQPVSQSTLQQHTNSTFPVKRGLGGIPPRS